MQDQACLEQWLARIERLHVKSIDLTLDRVRAVAQRLGLALACPSIVVGGTNGKGSTCAMLESILRAAGYRVGLYSKPHLLRFNERARVDGVLATDAQLIEQFEAVESARTDEDVGLTYFEFTTLAILRWLQHADLDVAVLEVGLGGRCDAVNIIDADCAIVTSIDLDHMDYLGPTREHIGFEKAHIYRAGRPAICSDPRPPQSLLDVAARLGAELWRFGRDFNYEGDRLQWAYRGRAQRRASLPYPALRGANQLLNASGALAALEALADRLPVSQQAVRQGLLGVEIAGRFQVLPGRPTVILDVAHNPHAAAVLAQNLDRMGFYPRTHAVVAMLRDKDVAGVLRQLAGRVDCWHVGPTEGGRGLEAGDLMRMLEPLLAGDAKRQEAADVADGGHAAQAAHAAHAAHNAAVSARAYPSVAAAYAGALSAANPEDRILVFGSFLTVADVLRVRNSGA